MTKGLFITLEGIDGCGKSTHAILLGKYLRNCGYEVVHTREPGGTPLAEKIRSLLLNSDYCVFPLAELLLYASSRAQHTAEIIKPAISSGKIVICERYGDATVAYQGYGRQLDLVLIRQLNRISADGIEPDLTIVMDLEVSEGTDRVGKNRKKDRLEKERSDFYKRVRKGYLELAKKYPKRIKVVDSSGNLQEVHRDIIEIAGKILKRQ